MKTPELTQIEKVNKLNGVLNLNRAKVKYKMLAKQRRAEESLFGNLPATEKMKRSRAARIRGRAGARHIKPPKQHLITGRRATLVIVDEIE